MLDHANYCVSMFTSARTHSQMLWFVKSAQTTWDTEFRREVWHLRKTGRLFPWRGLSIPTWCWFSVKHKGANYSECKHNSTPRQCLLMLIQCVCCFSPQQSCNYNLLTLMSAILGIHSDAQKQSSWVPVYIPPENQIFRQQSAMEGRKAYLNMTIEENTALFPSLRLLSFLPFFF